ncbi:hypothetical protein D022_2410B, partial [Vibrio parahaemolyticus 12310]
CFFREVGIFDTALRRVHVLVNVVQVADCMVETVLECTQLCTVAVYVFQCRINDRD